MDVLKMNTAINRNEIRATKIQEHFFLLRNLLDWLFRRLALLPLVVVFVVIIWGGRHLFIAFDVPIKNVSVMGIFSNISKKEIEESVVPLVSDKGFLSLDLTTIAALLESRSWIESATVRRKWLGDIEIKVVEETPVARWGKDSFLNNQGEILQIENNSNLLHLPLLQGEEYSEGLLMKTYREVALLLQPASLKIMELKRDDRGVWWLTLSNGLELLIGHDQIIAKVRRFLIVWASELQTKSTDVASIDMRYENGVAVKWK
ncbi:MAG: cell division protein FtsQ [Porticoccus sp.]|jgi:cell division protein FtsQ|tara:strand:- start:1844 stop:2626 length:783 start_codon:yes stop_codon:yes gene_type:complete